MRSEVIVTLLVGIFSTLALGQPQRSFIIRIEGELPEGAVLIVWLASGNVSWDAVCTIVEGVCKLSVERFPITIKRIVTPPGFAVVRAKGSTLVQLSEDLLLLSRFLTLTPEGVAANMDITPYEEGYALMIEVKVLRAQVITIDVSKTVEGFSLYQPTGWQTTLPVTNGTLQVVVPDGLVVRVMVNVDVRSRPGRILESTLSQGATRVPGVSRGIVLNLPVRYGDPNASLAYFAVRWLREALQQYVKNERVFLSRIGFDAEAYLREVEFAVIALRESERAFESGDYSVGQLLFDKGLAKAASALEALNQVKADSIPSFLFLLTFTLFLSLIVSNIFERRKGLLAAGVFGLLFFAEIALVPYARMAFLYLDPSVLLRSSPSAVTNSIVTATFSLAIIYVLVLGAKGTTLSDFFWYSVKSMKRRKLRATLTIATIAVVTAAATAYLALGSITATREDVYNSNFKGLSLSRHITTVTYISGEQASQYIVAESYSPLTPEEVEWLSGASWVEQVYLVKAGRAMVSHGGLSALALLVATDAVQLDGAVVSRSLAERLGITVGSKILIEGRPVTVSQIFSDDQPPLLRDGLPLFELPQSQGVVIAPLSPAPREMQVYKLILEGNPPPGLRDQLVRMSYVWNVISTVSASAQVTTYVYESFKVCEANGTRASCFMVLGEFVQASAVPEFTIILLLSAAVVAVSLFGSIYERSVEYSTVSALGASPLYVSALVLVEGLSYGILGGVAGFVLGQLLQSLIPVRVVVVRPLPLSPVLMSMLVALLPSMIGSMLPAREAAIKVVPSRLMLRKAIEVEIYQDMAEAIVPLRITSDAEEFAQYVQSLVQRASPVSWGPIYMGVNVKRRDGIIDEIETLVSFRSQRAALYRVKIILPKGPGETIRVVAYSATDKWTTDHRACAREFLTSIHNDLLRYIEWKKMRKG